MKLQYQAVLFIIMLNLSPGTLMALGLLPATYGVYNSTFQEDPDELFDPNGTIESFTGTSSTYSFGEDPVFGLHTLWKAIRGVVYGFPDYVAQVGMPSPLQVPIMAAWWFIWGSFAYEAITRRVFSDD